MEGKAIRLVEITTHLATPLTEVEKKSFLENLRMVSELVAVQRRAKGWGTRNIEAAIDTQVCQNEITGKISKGVRGTTEAEVCTELGTQAMVIYWKA